MRNFTAEEENKIKILTDMSISMTYLEPTKTGLEKSIMDATAIVRLYLKEQGIHDYAHQLKGSQNKLVLKGYIVTEDESIESSISLYRPETKSGDPRIWISKLNHYVNPNDILSIIVYGGKLYIFNLSKIKLDQILNEQRGPLFELLSYLSQEENVVANELLIKLAQIAKQGPIATLVNSDTGVGRTLEQLLGISMNSSMQPDYKGIELKSFRGLPTNRKNLFAQVPDWTISKFKSSGQILDNFGYTRKGEFRLYCTVSAKVKNSQGLSLHIDDINDFLVETSDKENIGDFAVWRIEKLKQRLLEKHKETFWIKAESKMIEGKEHFIYKEILHTKKPVVSQLEHLIAQGIITMDHLIKRTAIGKVKEKGPIFKIHPNSLPLLIPNPRYYDLIKPN